MNLLKDPTLLRTQAWLDGRWAGADDGATFTVENPATGECIARVPNMGAAETARAETCRENAAVLVVLEARDLASAVPRSAADRGVADIFHDEVLLDEVEHRQILREHDDLQSAAHALVEELREQLPLA